MQSIGPVATYQRAWVRRSVRVMSGSGVEALGPRNLLLGILSGVPDGTDSFCVSG